MARARRATTGSTGPWAVKSGPVAVDATLTRGEHRRKEQILTQPEPAKVWRTADAIVLKQGRSYLLTEASGDIPWELPHGLGFFSDDCRFLDGYALRINGEAPYVLSASEIRGTGTTHSLTNPQLDDMGGDGVIPKDTLSIRRDRLIRANVLHERISVRNYGTEPVGVEVELRFRARFEDIFVLKGFVPGPRGRMREARFIRPDVVRLAYDGVDYRGRTTTITFSPVPDRLLSGRATFRARLDPPDPLVITVSFTTSVHRADQTPARHAHADVRTSRPRRWLERAESIWLDRSAQVTTSNTLFDRVLDRGLRDLRELRSRLDGLHYFAAGVPWFGTLFGRDAAITGIQTLPFGMIAARDMLRLLARYQAKDMDSYRDAEPGKILHEYRAGELARSSSIPQSPAYYGSVDSTLLFLIMLVEYVHWSGDLELARRLRPNIEAALEWSETYADHDRDGYLDYRGEYPTGLINQGWKDSGNAIPAGDGGRAVPPIALCEVQAYAYRAWRQTALLLRALGERARPVELEARADDIRERFERDFWSEELGCYVLARMRGGVPSSVVSSNAGQVLWGGIASAEHAERVIRRLMEPDMFSGWGIRTLSSDARDFNPVSYHLGSVWPHDNALIAAGFRRYGHDREAMLILEALFDAAAGFRDHRVPELFCGYHRLEGESRPVPYPVACSPQAWAAGAIPHALWSLLGLRARALERRLILLRPRLPRWLDWVEMRNLRVNDARVDLRYERVDDEGRAEVRSVVRQGELDVEHVEATHVDEWRPKAPGGAV